MRRSGGLAGAALALGVAACAAPASPPTAAVSGRASSGPADRVADRDWMPGFLSALLHPRPAAPAEAPAPNALTLSPVSYADLPGWAHDHQARIIPALRRQCAMLARLPPDEKLGGEGEAARLAGTPAAWGAICAEARSLRLKGNRADDRMARDFLEAAFQPYAIGQGLITGYYEPQVQGSRTRTGPYQFPLLRRPPDLVQADLGTFAPDLQGRQIRGRLAGRALVPYFDRAQIEDGALDSHHLEMLWLASREDAFFLQIQGSGRVLLPDGSVVRVGYAAQNGRPYVPIGRVLADRGEIPRAQVTMQSIRAWLAAHPDQAAALMDQNPSFVFFQENDGVSPDEGPPGALHGLPLTPGRSVAVDRHFVPLGAPLWLDTTDPVDGRKLQVLALAQDVGGAITGPVRADIFFGWGEAAEQRAGLMKAQGREYLLLPRGQAEAEAAPPA